MRIRFLLIALAAASSISCGTRLPTSPSCADVTGTYDVTYDAKLCPSGQYPAQWQLVQSGCDIESAPMPDRPTVSGTASGHSVHLVLVNGFTACGYRLEGDGQFDGTTIRATVAGAATGTCCPGQESVTITAVRRSNP